MTLLIPMTIKSQNAFSAYLMAFRWIAHCGGLMRDYADPAFFNRAACMPDGQRGTPHRTLFTQRTSNPDPPAQNPRCGFGIHTFVWIQPGEAKARLQLCGACPFAFTLLYRETSFGYAIAWSWFQFDMTGAELPYNRGAQFVAMPGQTGAQDTAIVYFQMRSPSDGL